MDLLWIPDGPFAATISDAPVCVRSWKILEPSEFAKYFSILVEKIWPRLATMPSSFILPVASWRRPYFVSVDTASGSFFFGETQTSTWIGSFTKDALDPISAAPRASANALRVVSRIFSRLTSSVSATPQPESLLRTLIPAPRSFNSSLAGFSLITLTTSETVLTSLKSAYVAFSRAEVSRQALDSSSPRLLVEFTLPISARLALELSGRKDQR